LKSPSIPLFFSKGEVICGSLIAKGKVVCASLIAKGKVVCASLIAQGEVACASPISKAKGFNAPPFAKREAGRDLTRHFEMGRRNTVAHPLYPISLRS
jgi:hypothetical protein